MSEPSSTAAAQVASWVAHDLSNMLVLLEGALDGWRADDRRAIADLEGALTMARELESRLSCLSERRLWSDDPVDVAALAHEVAALSHGRFELVVETSQGPCLRGDREALRVLLHLLVGTAGTRARGCLRCEGPSGPWIFEVESAAHGSLRPIAALLGRAIAGRHGGTLEEQLTQGTTRWRLSLPHGTASAAAPC